MNFQKDKFYKKLSSGVFYLSILIFIIAFNFSDYGNSGWTQQFLPNFNGKPLKNIIFTDSLTGYSLIGNDFDSNYVLKSTNSGYNWNIIRFENKRISDISFLNNDTGFAWGSDSGYGYLIKTNDGGQNWVRLNAPQGDLRIFDVFALNPDTIWIIDSYLDYFIRKTTNGGVTWITQFSSLNPMKKLYMYNYRIGFACESSKLLKTTNSGDNWILQSGEKAFLDIYFADSLTGWKRNYADLTNDTLVKTTNGGLNWFSVDVPRSGAVYGGNISIFGMSYFSNINKDTIWGSGGAIVYPGNVYKGILYKTTNGGQNWLIQIPDTAYRLSSFWFNIFLNKNIGWTYKTNNIGIHTTTGGDTTFLTGINNSKESISIGFTLFQNYPNPFNPNTEIGYELNLASNVILKVYTVQGKEIITLVNQKQNAGKYKVTFNGLGNTSGIYFYSLFLNGKLTDTKKMILLK